MILLAGNSEHRPRWPYGKRETQAKNSYGALLDVF